MEEAVKTLSTKNKTKQNKKTNKRTQTRRQNFAADNVDHG